MTKTYTIPAEELQQSYIRELLEAIEDLLGDLPSVQDGVCVHCGREYDDDILSGDCPSDDCPSFKARAALKAVAKFSAKNPDSTALPTPLLLPKGAALLPGKMYLRLYHGRTYPTQKLEAWGSDGPTFGPLLSYVHTYCSAFRIHGDYDRELWLKTHDDMIQWEGCFYGDMEVFIAGTGDKA